MTNDGRSDRSGHLSSNNPYKTRNNAPPQSDTSGDDGFDRSSSVYQSSRSSSRPYLPPPPSGVPPRASMAGFSQSQLNTDIFVSDGRSADLRMPPRAVSKLSAQKSYEVASPTASPPSDSPLISRRSSIDSQTPLTLATHFGGYTDGSSDSRASSRQASIIDTHEEVLNTQSVAEKFTILPSAALVIFPEEVEKDDWLHNPVAGEKEPNECDVFSKRGLKNVGGLIFLTIGTLMLFIGYPITSFVQHVFYPQQSSCSASLGCLRVEVPLLRNVRTGLIDPDTPSDVHTRIARDGSTQHLVFSDEFNKPGRSFFKDDDPFWQGVDLWYGATHDLEWYDPDALTTADGTLTIRFDQFQNHGLNYRSGMLQSWNRLCFKGGYIEASISLPGAGNISGFWPGFWTMGNLGRPGYMATSEGMWPYSYHDECDLGITANQSQSDGISYLPGMKLPACTCAGEDHPSPGNSRSAPEIDAIEASVGVLPDQTVIGTASQSIQVAPFDIWYQPNYDFVELYDSKVTLMNPYRGSSLQQAVSGLTNLNNDWYGGNSYQIYAFEYKPGAEGYTTWFVGKDRTWTVDGRALGPNGNIGQREIPNEPMSIIANFGISENFAQIDYPGIRGLLPATMRIDYIRIYQGDDGIMGCDPPGYPTTEYIAKHPEAYEDTKKITWEQTGYKWPTNSFVNGC